MVGRQPSAARSFRRLRPKLRSGTTYHGSLGSLIHEMTGIFVSPFASRARHSFARKDGAVAGAGAGAGARLSHDPSWICRGESSRVGADEFFHKSVCSHGAAVQVYPIINQVFRVDRAMKEGRDEGR